MLPYHYLQILFLVSELFLLLFKRSKNNGQKLNKDKRSLLILWVVIILSSTLGSFIAGYYYFLHIGNYYVLLYVGMAVCIIGFAIRWTAVIQLGKMFTVDVSITDEHNLKTTGLYKVVRHPSYLGLLLIIAGLAVCINNIVCLPVVIIPCYMAVSHRITVEERVLVAEFGQQYIDYKKRVNKLSPRIFNY